MLIQIQAAQRRDYLDGMARFAERLAQPDELGVPYREDDVAADRVGSREHRVRSNLRQTLVNEVLVRLAAAEGGRIVRHRVAVARLHEDEAAGRARWFRRRRQEE